MDSETFAQLWGQGCSVSAGVAKLRGPPQEEKPSECEADRGGQGQDLEGVLMSLLEHSQSLGYRRVSWIFCLVSQYMLVLSLKPV